MPLFRASAGAQNRRNSPRAPATRRPRAPRRRETIPAVRVTNDCFPGGHFAALLLAARQQQPSPRIAAFLLGSAICCCRLNGGGHFRTGAAAEEGTGLVSGPPAGARPRLAVHTAPFDCQTARRCYCSTDRDVPTRPEQTARTKVFRLLTHTCGGHVFAPWSSV